MSARSSKPGPVVWLTACGHGDEVGSIVVVQEIFRRLSKGKLIKGTVNSFPLMNPLGFEISSRHITLSDEDLNRSFPGTPSGSLAERIANKIFTTITQTKPTLVLDLHNDWIRSIPYALIDDVPASDHKRAHAMLTAYCNKTGFLMINDRDDSTKTLSWCLIKKGIPALTLELGESYTVNERNVKYGIQSIWNVLAYLKMTEPEQEFSPYPVPDICRGKILYYSEDPLSSTSGIIRFLSRPGDIVHKNQPVAKIYNAFGRLRETITARNKAIVLGHTDSSVSFPGRPIMAFGIL